MPVLLSLDKSNFDVTRYQTVGCHIMVREDGKPLTYAAENIYADYDRNQLHAMRRLMGKLMSLVLERVNEEVAHTVRFYIDPKLWLVKIEVD